MNDLNVCSGGGGTKPVQFAQNYGESCSVDLASWVEHEAARGMQFVSVYVDFWENNHRIIKTVPVLIRNGVADENAGENVDDWQLVSLFSAGCLYRSINFDLHHYR